MNIVFIINKSKSLKCFYLMICLNLLNNNTNIMEMIMPLIKLKGMTPDTITIFTLLSTSPKLNIIPYNGSNTK